MHPPIRTRFAPTPSGFLHVGNAFSFVLAWLTARSSPNGYIHLRIDDIDSGRAREEYIADIFESLDWLGLDWDGGPQSVLGFYNHHSQHLRLDAYNGYLEEMKQQGKLFACICSRKQILDNSVDGQYDGHCLHLNLPFDAPETAWRINTLQGQSTVEFNDVKTNYSPVDLYQNMRHFAVRTKNGLPAYQLASVADDIAYNINFVVRGADLLYSTAAQCFLAQQVPGLHSFTTTRFLHHGLWLDDKGEKLSKSRGSMALADLRQACEPPAKLYLQIADRLQLPPATTANELLTLYNARIS